MRALLEYLTVKKDQASKAIKAFSIKIKESIDEILKEAYSFHFTVSGILVR